jgi:hypothetical protein
LALIDVTFIANTLVFEIALPFLPVTSARAARSLPHEFKPALAQREEGQRGTRVEERCAQSE